MTPSAMRPDGTCPTCGSDVETPAAKAEEVAEDERAPWHFRVARGDDGRLPGVALLSAPHLNSDRRPSLGSTDDTHGLWRSLVSALDWGSRGRRFKSSQPDHRGQRFCAAPRGHACCGMPRAAPSRLARRPLRRAGDALVSTTPLPACARIPVTTSVSPTRKLPDAAALFETLWGTGATLDLIAARFADDERMRSDWARYERISATPTSILAMYDIAVSLDVRDLLPRSQSRPSCSTPRPTSWFHLHTVVSSPVTFPRLAISRSTRTPPSNGTAPG